MARRVANGAVPPARQIICVALRHLRRAGLRAFAAQGARQRLGGDFAFTVHQHDERRAVLILHHQGFDDTV